MGHFQLIADHLATAPILEAVERMPHLWDTITARQTYPGSAHHDTQSIYLRWCEQQDALSAFTVLQSIEYPASAILWPTVGPVVESLRQSVGSVENGRVLLVRLKPGGRIDPHSDEGAYADHFERFHVVLQSDEGNEFTAGGESVWMRPGEAWWFNHKVEHRVDNHSARARIHVIVDLVAPKYRRERVSRLSGVAR